MLPSHLAVMRAIEACRTEALGGRCTIVLRAMRHGTAITRAKIVIAPSASNKRARFGWNNNKACSYPRSYFLVTFTLPVHRRVDLARRKQELVYNLFFRASAAALQELVADPRFVGGQDCGGMVCCRRGRAICAIIRTSTTWGQAVDWLPMGNAGWHRDPKFLVRVEPLGRLFRGKSASGGYARPACLTRFRRRPGAKTGWWTADRGGRGQTAPAIWRRTSSVWR